MKIYARRKERFVTGRQCPLYIFAQIVTINNQYSSLYNSDNVTLKHVDTGLYMVAENGGGGAVNVNRTVPAQWETFQIVRLGPYDAQSGIVATATPSH